MSEIPKGQGKTPVSRRDVVKTITIGGTTLAITQWSKPIVEAVVAPVHAQSSPEREEEVQPAVGFDTTSTASFTIPFNPDPGP